MKLPRILRHFQQKILTLWHRMLWSLAIKNLSCRFKIFSWKCLKILGSFISIIQYLFTSFLISLIISPTVGKVLLTDFRMLPWNKKNVIAMINNSWSAKHLRHPTAINSQNCFTDRKSWDETDMTLFKYMQTMSRPWNLTFFYICLFIQDKRGVQFKKIIIP